MTIWGVAGIILSLTVYAVVWFRGGHPERFAVAVLLLHFAVAAMSFAYRWEREGFILPLVTADSIRILILGWLCFRSNRWWPLLVTATLGLIGFVDVLRLLDPTVSRFASASAQIGLGYLVDLALLFGVFERILAGERPAGRDAWARAVTATEARLARKEAARRSASPPHAPEKASAP
ncbi:MAG: hypothetical protein EON89_13710 [Brevundimonas sp.]|nr:MAG: hypothetical protein EON89_13710 [Brevundimonas sp.]